MIFISYSSKQKKLVDKVTGKLDRILNKWIDTEQLLIGDDLKKKLKSVIKSNTDYFILFIDDSAIKSPWVKREVQWALEAEKETSRTIIIPIIIDQPQVEKININPEIKKCLQVKSTTLTEITSLKLANEILSHLLARELGHSKAGKSKVADFDDFLNELKIAIVPELYNTSRQKPMLIDQLYKRIKNKITDNISFDDFEKVLREKRIPFDSKVGYSDTRVYLIEEGKEKIHINRAAKEKIGSKVSEIIKSDSKIFLDAGSTTASIASKIRDYVRHGDLENINVITTSVEHAYTLSTCSISDLRDSLRVFIPGGEIRLHTQVIKPIKAIGQQILEMSSCFGGVDIGIVSTNAVDHKNGFTTMDRTEAENKRAILEQSKIKIILSDSSKVGRIPSAFKFAELSDDIIFYVNNDLSNDELSVMLKLYPKKIILV